MSLETDLAWAAGIVDGEGCILICRPNDAFQLRLTVNNTDIRMLEKMKGIFGGAICNMNRKFNPNHKPCWNWCVGSRQAEVALVALLPYLVCKKDQAELGISSRQYTGRGTWSSMGMPRGTKRSAEDREALQVIMTKLVRAKRSISSAGEPQVARSD